MAHIKLIRIVLLASLVATVVIYSYPRTWELDLIAALQGNLPGYSLWTFQFISNSISFFSIGLPVALLVAALIRKNSALREKAILVLISIALGGLLSYGVKKLVKEPRPYEIDARIAQWSGGGGYGFPSGHTVEAVAAVATATLIWMDWTVAAIGFSWALLIMFSRIYLGVHDPGDVMAGTFLGCLSALIVVAVWTRRESSTSSK